MWCSRVFCTLRVPGERTHNGANHSIRHRQALEADRHWLGCRGNVPPLHTTSFLGLATLVILVTSIGTVVVV